MEREENERLEAARLAKLEEMKKQLEAEREKQKSAGGVVYKGEFLEKRALCGSVIEVRVFLFLT